MQRITWLDTIKAVSIILVVYYHFIVGPYNRGMNIEAFDKNVFDSINHFIIYNLAPLRMPLFFLVSGYLSINAINRPWKEVASSRIGLYIYLFILWGLIQRTVVWAIGIDISVIDILKANYSENIKDFVTLTMIGASSLWYLYALALYFSICKIFKQFKLTCILILMVCSIASKSFDIIFPYKSMIYCVFFYASGVFYGDKIFLFIEKLTWKKLIYIPPLFIILIFARATGFSHYFVESIAFVFLAILTFMNLSKVFNFRILNFIGKNTLGIYVLHTPLLEVCSFLLLPSILSLEILTSYSHIGFSILMPLILVPSIIGVCIAVHSLLKNGLGKYLFDYRYKFSDMKIIGLTRHNDDKRAFSARNK